MESKVLNPNYWEEYEKKMTAITNSIEKIRKLRDQYLIDDDTYVLCKDFVKRELTMTFKSGRI